MLEKIKLLYAAIKTSGFFKEAVIVLLIFFVVVGFGGFFTGGLIGCLAK